MKLMHSHSIHQVVNDGIKRDSHKRISVQTLPTRTDAYEVGSGNSLQTYRGPHPVQNRQSWFGGVKVIYETRSSSSGGWFTVKKVNLIYSRKNVSSCVCVFYITTELNVSICFDIVLRTPDMHTKNICVDGITISPIVSPR
jgi:hypothetical protein